MLAGLMAVAAGDAGGALARKEREEATKAGRDLVEAEPARIAEALAGLGEVEARRLVLAAFGKAVVAGKAYARGASAVEALVARGDITSALAAGDALIAMVRAAEWSAYGLTRETRGFGDEVCAQAAALLDHPNPVVQAQAEWALALRVKRQGEMAKFLADMPEAAFAGRDWYVKWLARDRKLDLRDDYARQLAQMGRHLSLEGVRTAVGKTSALIEKMAADAGSRPVGAAEAAYGKALAAARAAADGSDLEEAHAAYLALREAARGVVMACRADFPGEGFVFFTNPAVPGGQWNVNVPVTGNTNPPKGDIYAKRVVDPAARAEALLGDKLGAGSVRGLDLIWEGDKILFSFWSQPLGDFKPFGYRTEHARIYEMDLKAGEPRRLTDAPGYNDIEPCFLPDGGYVFASDRSSFGNQCAGPILQNKRCTTLFRLDPRRADAPVAISNNKDFDRHPHVLNDGTISFLHWEYQERGLYHSHTLWRCRPDGSNMDALYKQHISEPMSMRDAQQAPGSEMCVATAQGHHNGHFGPIVLFNPSLGINNADAMWLVTPGVGPVEGGLGPLPGQVVPEGGVESGGGYYINPFPMSDKAFLAGHDMAGDLAEFSIYYVDVWGNRELLHKDDSMSCFQPYPLRKRERPPVVADMIDPKATFATAFVADVYRDLPGVAKGEIKYLRLSQSLMLPAPVYEGKDGWDYNHMHYLPGDATARHFAYWAWSPSRTVGMVDVSPEGSAYFKVPAGTPVYLQALDADYTEVRRMRSSFTLQRGELRGCAGCHETRLEAVGNLKPLPSALLARGPQTPVAPAWGDTTVLDYEEHIQPVIEKHCASCHDAAEPDGGLDLTGRKIGGFAQAYRSMFGLKPDAPTPVNEVDWHLVLNPDAKDGNFLERKEAHKAIIAMQANEWPGMLIKISDRQSKAEITMPRQFGSGVSRLIRVLLDDPMHRKDVKDKMSGEEWLKLVTWVDYNAVYHGTVFDVRHYNQTKTFTRVKYALPSPWEPADLNPSFLNVAKTGSEAESAAAGN